MAVKRSTIGALLLLLLGVAGVLGWYFLRPLLFDWSQRRTSDATGAEVTLRIGGDNYLGYWFITSPEMRKQAARRGIGIQFEDDGGAYSDRLQKFAAGEYDAIVLPVNSYLQHGAAVNFPGVIVAAISESKGADGMVGFADQLPSGKIEDLNDADLEIVYTSASPSEFLLDLTIADFDLDELQSGDRWRREVGSSREVYKQARDNQGDVFVLWEPDLSRALSLPGMKYVWGSDRFSGYIVDVFVFRRDFLKDRGEAVRIVYRYFPLDPAGDGFAAAVAAVPVAKRLGLGSILGYLIAGVVIGPFALGLVGEEGVDVMHFAEFGVVMLVYLREAINRHRPVNESQLRAAVIEGAVLRVRPKAMTAAVIIAGLMPIMLGSGTGSEIMRRIAAPMVGGMVTAPMVSMLLLPVMYYLWYRRKIMNRPARSEETP